MAVRRRERGICTEKFICLRSRREAFRISIPIQNAPSLQRNICQQCRARAAVAGLDIAVALGAAFDAVQKVARVWRGSAVDVPRLF